jgi:rhodanese-related sulfurtransferase
MISLKQLFHPVASMDVEQARAYMADHAEGTYTLLDVRQPSEYKKEHIPGATLIPIPLLADSIGELDPEKPTIVY